MYLRWKKQKHHCHRPAAGNDRRHMSVRSELRFTALPYSVRDVPKSKRNIGKEILAGLRQLRGGEHARITRVPDVAQIRKATGLSQARFAQLLGVSPRTLQDWEQGRRAPSGAARTLLLVAAKDPKALLAVA